MKSTLRNTFDCHGSPEIIELLLKRSDNINMLFWCFDNCVMLNQFQKNNLVSQSRENLNSFLVFEFFTSITCNCDEYVA